MIAIGIAGLLLELGHTHWSQNITVAAIMPEGD